MQKMHKDAIGRGTTLSSPPEADFITAITGLPDMFYSPKGFLHAAPR